MESYTKSQKILLILQQERLKFDPLPPRPFVDVSADLFEYAGKSFLMNVDNIVEGLIKLLKEIGLRLAC